MRVRKYLIGLLVIGVLMAIIRIWASPSIITTWWMRAIEICFYLSPALLAWAVEQSSLKEFCQEYLFCNKDTNWKKVLHWILLTVISYPMLTVLFVFIGGNLSGIDTMGQVMSVSENFTYMGISFNGGSLWGNVSLSIVNLLWALFYGVTLGTLTYIGEEVGWRGFLEKNLPCMPVLRPLFAGIIWTLWGLPFYESGVGYWLTLLVFNIAFSFYLSEAARQSHSIWTAAAIRGIVSACSLSVVEPGNSDTMQLAVALCAVAVTLAVSRLVKTK